MQNAIFGMRTLNVTQGNFSSYSHKGINALDLAGEDTGKDVWRAKNRWKCTNVLPYASTGFANTCFFSPCDESGNLVEVMTPSGVKKLTIALTHDDDIRVKVGEIYEGDVFIYREGTTGKVTGAHTHAEACFDFVTAKIKLTGSQYYNGSSWVLPNAVPLHEALFLLKDYAYTPLNDGGYPWQYVDSIEVSASEVMVESYVMAYKGYSIKIGKLSKGVQIMGSVDGNKYGVQYDRTEAKGFSDKDLLAKGFTEAFATNGSTFYIYDGATFAEGIEISKGVNNQEYGLSCVSKFGDCMALGFTNNGAVIFDLQKNLQARNDLYGAVTGAFGIMKDGKLNTAGAEQNRGNCFTVKSGRTIWAEDNENYYSICFYGVTGQSGLTGAELYDLVKTVSPTMENAICFDGGGSVWQRINGSYTITTERLVKNGVMLFYKKDEPSTPSNPNDELENKIKELENQVKDYQEQLSDALAENDKLQKEIDTLRATIEELENKLSQIKNILI